MVVPKHYSLSRVLVDSRGVWIRVISSGIFALVSIDTVPFE